MFWLKVKAFFSRVGDIILPFIKMFMSEMGPVILDIAQQVVMQVATQQLSSSEKRDEAYKQIMIKLEGKSIEAASHVVYSAIEVAVAKLKDK